MPEDRKIISTQKEWEEAIRVARFEQASDYTKFKRSYAFNPSSRIRLTGKSIREVLPKAPQSSGGRWQIFEEAMQEGRTVEEVNVHAKAISKDATWDSDILIALFNGYVELWDVQTEAERIAEEMAVRVEGPSLDRLDWLLAVAAKVADRAAKEVRDVDLNREVNIRRVGEALGNLFEIRNEIYEKRPDLMPEFLKGKW